MSFQLVPKSVSVSETKRRNDRYIAFFSLKLVKLRSNT